MVERASVHMDVHSGEKEAYILTLRHRHKEVLDDKAI